MAPGQGTGFVSVGQYLDANQGTLANEADHLNTDLSGQIAGAKSSADSLINQNDLSGAHEKDYTTLPGYGDALDKAIHARDNANSIQTHGGMADYFKSQFKDSQPQADFDANLLGGSQFSHFATDANGLTNYLNGGLAGVPERPPDNPKAGGGYNGGGAGPGGGGGGGVSDPFGPWGPGGNKHGA